MSNFFNHQETNMVAPHSGQGRLAYGARTPQAKSTSSVSKGKVKHSFKPTLGQSGTHGHVLLEVDGSKVLWKA